MQDNSQSELPSPIVQAPDKKSKRKGVVDQIQSLQQSMSVSSKDEDSFLNNLKQFQEKQDDRLAQSIHIETELTPPVIKNLDILTDPLLRNDNNNQSTEADMTLSGKNNANARKTPLNSQPEIAEMQESVFLDEDIVRSSLILARYQMNANKSSLEKIDNLLERRSSQKNPTKDSKNQIKSSVRSSINKMRGNRDWAPVQIPHDIFQDEEILTEVCQDNPKSTRKQIRNEVRVNFVERSQKKQENASNSILPNIQQALHQNFSMLNTWHVPSQNNQNFPPPQQNNFLHPHSNHTNSMHPGISMHHQMHPNQTTYQNMGNFYQPPQNFNNPLQYSHAVNYVSQNHPASPRSEAFWNPVQNPYTTYSPYSRFDIMNQVRDLRRQIRILRDYWHEERADKIYQRCNSVFQKNRKFSEDLGKPINNQLDVNQLLDHQQAIYEKSLKQVQEKFIEKIQKLQKQQKSLRAENQMLRRRVMFKQTGSFDLINIDQVPKTFRQSHKKKSTIDFQKSSKYNKTEEFLKEKLSTIKKESSVKRFKLKKENSRSKSNKPAKKDKNKL